MTLYRVEGSSLSSAGMRTVTPHNHGPLSAVRECINLIHTITSMRPTNPDPSRLTKATMSALLTLIIRPLVLFVVTGAMVSFLRYTVTMWKEVPSLMYELYVFPSRMLCYSIIPYTEYSD